RGRGGLEAVARRHRQRVHPAIVEGGLVEQRGQGGVEGGLAAGQGDQGGAVAADGQAGDGAQRQRAVADLEGDREGGVVGVADAAYGQVHVLEGGLVAGHRDRGGDVADEDDVVAVTAVVVNVERHATDLQRRALRQAGEGAAHRVGAVVPDDDEAFASFGGE